MLVGRLDEAAAAVAEVLRVDVDRCINEVTIKLLRFNLATGQTVEVSSGPYRDQASILWRSRAPQVAPD